MFVKFSDSFIFVWRKKIMICLPIHMSLCLTKESFIFDGVLLNI